MPRKRCETCGKVFNLKQKDYKKEHPDLESFCTFRCLMNYVRSFELNGGRPAFESCSILTGDARVVEEPGYCTSSLVCGSYRSMFEVRFAEFLDASAEEFIYEPHTFVLPPVNGSDFEAHVTLDFLLPKRDVYIETKGMWGFGQKSRYSRLLACYPQVRMVLVPWRFVGDVSNGESIPRIIR